MNVLEWLMAQDTTTQVLYLSGVGLIIAGLGVEVIRRGWRGMDPPYRGEQRRGRRPSPYDLDPKTGELVMGAEVRDAATRYLSTVTTDPAGQGTHTWPTHRPPAGVGEGVRRIRRGEVVGRRSLAGDWRDAVRTPTGSWMMPDAGRHHHRRDGGPREETRPLHPGYRAAARAMVQPEDPQ